MRLGEIDPNDVPDEGLHGEVVLITCEITEDGVTTVERKLPRATATVRRSEPKESTDG